MKPVTSFSSDPVRGIFQYYRHFAGEIGWLLHGFVGLCFLGVLAESLNIMALLPLLSSGDLVDSASRVGAFWAALLDRLGLAPTFGAMLGMVVVAGLLRTVLLSAQALAQGWMEIDLEARLRHRFVKLLAETSYLHFSGLSQGRVNSCLTSEIPDKVIAMNKFVQVIAAAIFTTGFPGGGVCRRTGRHCRRWGGGRVGHGIAAHSGRVRPPGRPLEVARKGADAATGPAVPQLFQVSQGHRDQ